MIACHSKPPATNVPLSHGTQTVTMDVTIDVGQDAIVAVGTTVNIRCNVTQVSNQFSCLIYTPLLVIGYSHARMAMVQRWYGSYKW